jgi:two-component system sensor histidine kinase PilS (NtrC family)
MGAQFGREGSKEETYRRLKWTLFLRVVVVTFLLGATVIVHLSKSPSLLVRPLIALYLLAGISYFIILVSLLIIRWVRRLLPFVYAQILWEVIFATSLIYITGGIESIFSFLYLLAVITASILEFRRGAFFAASFNFIFYASLLLALYFRILSPLLPGESMIVLSDLIYNIFFNFFAFFAVAGLSSYLTEKLRATGHELEETRDDLDQLEALNESIVRSIGSGLISLNPSGRITFINSAAEKITRRKAEDLLGHPFSSLFPQIIIDSPETARSHFTVTYQTPNQERLLLEVSVNALHDSRDREIGKLVIFSDITQLRAMEERLRVADRLAAVGKLAAGIAHEIRNPLAAISGSVQMLERDLTSDPTNKYLMQIVFRETDRLNSLINDFLIYARPVPNTMKEMDLNQVIKELLQVSHHRPDLPSNIEWETDLETGIRLTSDPHLIKQIFWNLINNAVEAMPSGGRIRIATRRIKKDAQDAEDLLEVRFEDTGIGIPGEYQDKIFDPFFTTRDSGSGLGLSIVWRIVEAMKGEITVESEVGRGSTFILRIPCRADFAEAEEIKPAVEGSH